MTNLDNYLNGIQNEAFGGINVSKEKAKPGYKIIMKASEIDRKKDRECQSKKNSDMVKCRCRGLKAATVYLKNNISRCKNDNQCISRIKKYIQSNLTLIKQKCR